MVSSKKLTQAFNSICESEDNETKQSVSQRLKEYIDSWDNNETEFNSALATKKYYENRKSNNFDDFVEYLVSMIVMDALGLEA